MFVGGMFEGLLKWAGGLFIRGFSGVLEELEGRDAWTIDPLHTVLYHMSFLNPKNHHAPNH